MRKTAPHHRCSTRTPPISGPTAAPAAATALHTPSAIARSRRSVKTCRMIESVAGMIIAPPTPRKARETMSASGVAANAADSEARPNTT